MDIYVLLIILCCLVVFSYIFEVVSRRLKFPSVIILIAFGIILRLTANSLGYSPQFLDMIVPVLGTIGLLLIVLEGSLELKITREKRGVLLRAFLASLVILLANALALSFLFSWLLAIPFNIAMVNAIPVSVISSAIAIPSAAHFEQNKKEFIVYESTFSDILGIIFFNFAISNETFDAGAFSSLGIEIVLVIIASVLLSYIVLLLLQNISHHIKSFLIIALLVLIYSAGKMLHISSLIVIFFFGLLMSNSEKFTPKFMRKYFDHKKINEELSLFFMITAESAFLVKTFFFLAFGFSINLLVLGDFGALSAGLGTILSVFVIRYFYLKSSSKGSIKPELFVAPRGLITILLFLSIPEKFKVPVLNEGFLLVVILVSLIILALATPGNKDSDAISEEIEATISKTNETQDQIT